MSKRIVVIVTGSREWTDARCIEEALKACEEPDAQMILVQGGARGADKMAQAVAQSRQWFRIVTLHPDWTRFGRSAGIRRNADMIAQWGPHAAHFLAFSVNKSRGTEHTIGLIQAKAGYERKLKVYRQEKE